MTKVKKTPTMKDVAAEAGVALGTVSKVFNGIPVGEEYRKKVEEAALKLGYKVNNYARGLKTNKTKTLALLFPTLTHPFYSALAEHCARYSSKLGYQMILATSDFNPEAEERILGMVQQHKVDGVICITYSENFHFPDDFPLVSIDRYFNSSIPCVSSDNYGGGYLAAKTLSDLDCKKLLMFQDSSNVAGEADKRQHGFISYCNMNQIDATPFIIRSGTHWNTFWNHLDEHIKDGICDYDGIFCATDRLAYQTVKELRKRQIRVPEDVQVIGYDGCRQFGVDDYYVSTIVQPLEQMAQCAIDYILSENRSSLPPLMCFPVTYAAGGTTKDSLHI